MVLAAGHGSRLRPLTLELPKPLVPLGDRPVLAHVVDAIRAAGIERLALNAFHKAEAVARWGEREGVFVSKERELLGTAGGVAHARAHLSGDVLVYNADIVARLDLGALVASLEGAAVLAVSPAARGEGNVGLDARGRVVRLRQSSFGDEAEGGFFMGVCTLARSLVAELPERGCLVGDVLIPKLAAGARVVALRAPAPFVDLGTPSAYLAANLAWLGDRSAFAHPTARVAQDVRLKRTIVGAGATVTGPGDLERCVVWPGATARAPLSSAVVTPQRVVPIEL